jgi:hypothetical protein
MPFHQPRAAGGRLISAKHRHRAPQNLVILKGITHQMNTTSIFLKFISLFGFC